jgi:cysteine desulfurase
MDPSSYFDWNATTPLAPEVVEAMTRALASGWGNPASVHAFGRSARAQVEDAREAVATLAGFDARDVVLTSGGTEANNLALAFGASLTGPRGERPLLVVSAVEHPSVVSAAAAEAERGARAHWIPVDPGGRIGVDAVVDTIDRALDDGGRAEGAERSAAAQVIGLVSVQAVNHETGVVHPIREIREVARARGLLLHVDAVQAVGRLERDAWCHGDLVTIASHKIRGPKGVGALLTAPRLKLTPILRGGAQERGIRPGTQDPVACAGFAVAARRAADTVAHYRSLAVLRDTLERALIELGARTTGAPIVNGAGHRAPHVTNLSWPGWLGAELAAALDLEGIAISSGSACSAGTADPSPVIQAIAGLGRARSAVRVSLGETTDAAAVDRALRAWERVLLRVVG